MCTLLRTHQTGCHNKWHPGTLEISTPLEIAVGTHFYAWHGTKFIAVFLPADGEVSWLLHPSLLFLLSGGSVQPENTKSCIPVWQVRSEKPENGQVSTLITAITTVHLPNPVSTDLTLKSDLVLTNPIGKERSWGWSV